MQQAKFELIKVFSDPKLNFHGNTSVVVQLPSPLPASQLQQIAADWRQPATTFLWQQDKQWHVRWFAPDAEIGLCGHGSLAAAAFLGKEANHELELLANDQKINVTYGEPYCQISLKAIKSSKAHPPQGLAEALGAEVVEYHRTNNKDIVVLQNDEAVAACQPDFGALANLKPFGYAITALGKDCDFVSRTLVPKVQQLEDPATGSSHAALAEFWGLRLEKNHLIGHQLSARGGLFICDRVDGQIILKGQFESLASGWQSL